MPSLSNYPPGVSGNEPQITGDHGGPSLYLRHDTCGEVFDTIETAADHMMLDDCTEDNDWSIIPEGDAF